ncbi:MAG: FAD-dependent oxidoreductase [Pseudomonadota bacterium]
MSSDQASPATSAETRAAMNYRLSKGEIEQLCAYGERRHHKEGDTLIDEGDVESDVLVLLSGGLNVYLHEDGEERRVGWLEPGQFTGDVSVITGQPALIFARMVADGEVLHLSSAAMRRILVENSELSDVFVTTFTARRAWARSAGRSSVVLLGRALDRESFALRDLLSKHDVPFLWADVDADERGKTMVDRLGFTAEDLPVLVTGAVKHLVRPSIEEAGRALGLDLIPDNACADIIVVGAGPAGLAASVYAASEGLSVVTLDASAPGGQAGTSSKIENYLGFPSGISGQELADRARLQAQKFGVRIASPVHAATLSRDGQDYVLTTGDGRTLKCRAIVVATGANYRRLPIENLESYEGRGVYYGATAMEAQICQGSSIAIVGAGNSAGQGAVFLSKAAKDVHVLYRRNDIRETMSEYLVRRLEETPNIHLHPETEIKALHGDETNLKSVTIKTAGDEKPLDACFVFLFIGAAPCSGWLDETVARDDKGFLKTGSAIANIELVRAGWSLDRMPSQYETTWPRVFAVGDVRAGSVKRVASGVGEGSVVIQAVHRAVSEISR